MNAVLTFFKKYWHAILPGIVGLWAVYGSSIKAYVAAHPNESAVIGALYTIFAALMPGVAGFTAGGKMTMTAPIAK